MERANDMPANGAPEVVHAAVHEIGDGFRVRRALPTAKRRMVGPFVFLDQMGPVGLAPGQGMDVRPHPHIGLSTLTYLFEGEILHRDSLGTVQPIRPGEVNWMTAGRGIVHSERTPPTVRASGGVLSGMQVWVALPQSHEELGPSFVHLDAEALPTLEDGGAHVRVVAGSWGSARSRLEVFSDLFYAAATLTPGARLPVPEEHVERAIYVAAGEVEIAGERFGEGQLLLLRPKDPITLQAVSDARVIALGGEPLEGPRHIWWNFVSSSRDRIEQAKLDWEADRLGRVPEETERIPLPHDPPGVRYR